MINYTQLRAAQRLAAAAVETGDTQKWEKAKKLYRKATRRTLH